MEKITIPRISRGHLSSAFIFIRNVNLWKPWGFQAVAAYTLQSLYGKDSEISFLRVNSNFSTRGIHQRNPARNPGNTRDGKLLHIYMCVSTAQDNIPSNLSFCCVKLVSWNVNYIRRRMHTIVNFSVQWTFWKYATLDLYCYFFQIFGLQFCPVEWNYF